MCDPGHCAAISLTLSTTAFLTLEPNLDDLVAAYILLRLTDEIGERLLECHAAIESKYSHDTA